MIVISSQVAQYRRKTRWDSTRVLSLRYDWIRDHLTLTWSLRSLTCSVIRDPLASYFVRSVIPSYRVKEAIDGWIIYFLA